MAGDARKPTCAPIAGGPRWSRWILAAALLAAPTHRGGAQGIPAVDAELQDPVEREDRDEFSQRPSIARPHKEGLEQDPRVTPFRKWNYLTDGWFGLRPRLSRSGISFEATLTVDASRNLSGGIDSTRTVAPYLVDVNLSIDSSALGVFPGGFLFLDLQQSGGDTGQKIVNDSQVFSNIAAEPRTQLAQLWFEQRLAADRIRLKLGKVDANSDFAYVDHGMLFLNSSMGVSPTIQFMPTYPDAAYGFNAFVHPMSGVYSGVGIYDGALQSGTRTGIHGPVLRHLFLIGETGLTWVATHAGLAGRLGLGGWYHSGDFDRFDGGFNTGASGAYATFDQLVYREPSSLADDSQGVGWFVQYGYADDSVSPIDHHFGTGITWTGAIPYRDRDALGLGVSVVHFSSAPGAKFSADFETSTEWFYTFQLTGFFALTFDLQAITNPGGIDGQPDAWTGTTRLVLNL